MIENSDIEATEDECVCSLGTFDDAIPKAFMKATCDDNNISLDGQFGAPPYLLEQWSASLKGTCVASWSQGLHSGIDPTVRTQSCQLLEVISGSFTQGIFRRLCDGGFVPRINGTRQSNNDEEIHNVLPEDGAFERESVARWAQKLEPY